MKKIYCAICSKYRKLEKPKTSYILEKTLVLSIIFCLSRPYPFKFLKGCLPQNLLSPLLNTLSHLSAAFICKLIVVQWEDLYLLLLAFIFYFYFYSYC